MNDYKYLYSKKLQIRARIKAAVLLMLIVGTAGIVCYLDDRSLQYPKDQVVTNCAACHDKISAYTTYFRTAGSKSPQAMAEAVLSTRNPRLMAAIAKVETNGNPHIRRSGYKKRHDGAFQVNPYHWGKVSNDPVAQALQAEAIITELTTDHGIKKALSVYGGDSSSRYQRQVLAELERAPQ